jgi:hypothetical protein
VVGATVIHPFVILVVSVAVGPAWVDDGHGGNGRVGRSRGGAGLVPAGIGVVRRRAVRMGRGRRRGWQSCAPSDIRRLSPLVDAVRAAQRWRDACVDADRHQAPLRRGCAAGRTSTTRRQATTMPALAPPLAARRLSRPAWLRVGCGGSGCSPIAWRTHSPWRSSGQGSIRTKRRSPSTRRFVESSTRAMTSLGRLCRLERSALRPRSGPCARCISRPRRKHVGESSGSSISSCSIGTKPARSTPRSS